MFLSLWAALLHVEVGFQTVCDKMFFMFEQETALLLSGLQAHIWNVFSAMTILHSMM